LCRRPDGGAITAANSVLGTTASGGGQLNFGYDTVNQQLAAGRPADNIVSLFSADDRDGDCVNDTVEDSAPNSGDGNTDGTPDKLQGASLAAEPGQQ
jgi:hypothetical protein